MGTAIQKTSGSCMGDFGGLRSQSSAGFLGAYQRGISVWGCSPKAVPLVIGDARNNVGYHLERFAGCVSHDRNWGVNRMEWALSRSSGTETR